MTITVYSKPDCSQCEQTKKLLNRKGLPYKEIDVSKDAEARKLVKDSAFDLRPAVMLPMVIVKDGRGNVRCWHGFRYDELKGLTQDS